MITLIAKLSCMAEEIKKKLVTKRDKSLYAAEHIIQSQSNTTVILNTYIAFYFIVQFLESK